MSNILFAVNLCTDISQNQVLILINFGRSEDAVLPSNVPAGAHMVSSSGFVIPLTPWKTTRSALARLSACIATALAY